MSTVMVPAEEFDTQIQFADVYCVREVPGCHVEAVVELLRDCDCNVRLGNYASGLCGLSVYG